MIWYILAGALVSLVVSFVLGGICADCAVEKGYDWYKAFWVCFILGLTGCFLTAALPDKTLRKKAECIRYSDVISCN